MHQTSEWERLTLALSVLNGCRCSKWSLKRNKLQQCLSIMRTLISTLLQGPFSLYLLVYSTQLTVNEQHLQNNTVYRLSLAALYWKHHMLLPSVNMMHCFSVISNHSFSFRNKTWLFHKQSVKTCSKKGNLVCFIT